MRPSAWHWLTGIALAVLIGYSIGTAMALEEVGQQIRHAEDGIGDALERRSGIARPK